MDIEKCFKRLLIKNPFYGLFCLNLPKVITNKVPTLCVSKQGINCQLNINPEFWETKTDDEQLAILQHELGHICLQHVFMGRSFKNSEIFNIAADTEVNSYIENLPNDAVTAQLISKKIGKHLEKGLGTKKYYEEISAYINSQQAQAKNPSMPCNGGQGGTGTQSDGSALSPSQAAPNDSQKKGDSQEEDSPPSSSEQHQQPQDTDEEQRNSPKPSNQQQESSDDEERESPYPEEFADKYTDFGDHSTWKEFEDVPEATKQLMQNNINTILKNTAEQVEKMHGTIPGEFAELIDKLRTKKPEVFNWKAYFRRMLGTIYDVNIRSTRRKVSKRYEGAAGIQHRKKVSILVAIDTSGSVSKEELQEFFSEIDYVYKAGARVTLMQCDTRITSVEDYNGKNIPEIKGRGGTDFNPPVDYYVKHIKEYSALIYFTDGESSLPRKRPQGIVWVISSRGLHQDFPGKTIYIPKNNNG
jgi:predicted metal-dependent peptidase